MHQKIYHLKGITDPEENEKQSRVFIEVFDEESHRIQDEKWLVKEQFIRM